MDGKPPVGVGRLLLQIQRVCSIHYPSPAPLFTRRGVPERLSNLIKISELVLESIWYIDHDMVVLLSREFANMSPDQRYQWVTSDMGLVLIF